MMKPIQIIKPNGKRVRRVIRRRNSTLIPSTTPLTVVPVTVPVSTSVLAAEEEVISSTASTTRKRFKTLGKVIEF